MFNKYEPNLMRSTASNYVGRKNIHCWIQVFIYTTKPKYKYFCYRKCQCINLELPQIIDT